MLSKNKITPRYNALTASACPGNCLNGNSLIIWFCSLETSQALPTPCRCSMHPQSNKGSAAGQGPKFCLISGQFEARRHGTWPAQSLRARGHLSAPPGPGLSPTAGLGPRSAPTRGTCSLPPHGDLGGPILSSSGLNYTAACSAEGSFAVIRSMMWAQGGTSKHTGSRSLKKSGQRAKIRKSPQASLKPELYRNLF